MRNTADLVQLLTKYSDEYYNDPDSCSISDAEFDKLKAELKTLDPSNTFFKVTGAKPAKHLAEVDLMCPMHSQNHATTDSEFWDWYNKHNQPSVIITDKVDGNSVELWYQDGKLKRVATRGDGKVGNDITANASYWANIPKTITAKGKVLVRCEAVLLIDLWKKHFTTKANPRNAGTGITLRKSEPEGNKHINAYAFDITCDVKFKTQEQKLKLLRALGFETVRYFMAPTKAQVEASWKKYNEQRSSLPFEIDGVVVCIDDLVVQEALGSTSDDRPKGQTAWKFPPAQAMTIFEGMTITMGHTGAIIPTAKVKPVFCGGITISNILFTTWDRVKSFNVNIGDEILIERSGDVIPYPVRVTTKHSTGHFPIPTNCHHCNSVLEWEGAYLMCKNTDDCPGQVYKRVRNYLDKTGVKDIGDGLLEALFEAKLVKNIEDIYALKADDLENLPVGNGVLGSKRAQTAIDEINKIREMDIATFMGSLSLKGLGRRLAEIFGLQTVNDFLTLTEDKAKDLPSMGDKKAKIIVTALQANKDRILAVEKCITIIVDPSMLIQVSSNGKFKGMAVCETGVRMTTDEKLAFMREGGEVKTSVSKNTTHLICKDPGVPSVKNQKAQALGVKLLAYADFQKMIQ